MIAMMLFDRLSLAHLACGWHELLAANRPAVVVCPRTFGEIFGSSLLVAPQTSYFSVAAGIWRNGSRKDGKEVATSIRACSSTVRAGDS